VTAAHVLRAANSNTYRTVPIGIARNGKWHLPEMAELPAGGLDHASVPTHLVAAGSETTSTLLSLLAESGPIVVMPLLHGPLGEDGTIQGLLEILDLPYVGSAVLASAVAMDKGVSKSIFAQAGIPQARHVTLREDKVTPDSLNDVVLLLAFPFL
jgi:D-alanine-D-alanine ligase